MHTLRCLDDALLELRRSLLGVCLSTPVFVKIVSEFDLTELHVFKIDLNSRPACSEECLASAQQAEVSPCEAMEVEDGDSGSDAVPSLISQSDSSEVVSPPGTDSVNDYVSSEAEMAVSMLQLVNDAVDRFDGLDLPATSDDEKGCAVSTTSESDNDSPPASRRSGRQRKAVNYVPSTSGAGVGAKRKSASTSAPSPPAPLSEKKKVKQKDNDDAADDRYGSDESDEVEIAALTTLFKEAFDRRSSAVVDGTPASKVLELVAQVLADPQDKAEAREGQPSLLQQCARLITRMITTSSAQKMVGYYLRSVLAHHLKISSRRQYSRLARDVLGIKSPSDIAAYPAFFEFVQRHCPSIVAATAQGKVTEEVMSQWLREPFFIADISWREWRRYLSKSRLHIAEAAVQRFLASIDSFKDWMQLGWVEIYDDERLGGQGVRALRDIHLLKSKARQDVASSISVVAADLHSAGPESVKAKDPALEEDPEYLIQLDQQRVFHARHHWIGKINHLPMPHCNLKVTGNGKLVQIKPIKAGDSLTLDYGMDFWVYQVTGLDASEWFSEGGRQCQRGRIDLFTRMHESVLDYSKLLREKWAHSLSSSSSAVDREALLVDLEDCLDASDSGIIARPSCAT